MPFSLWKGYCTKPRQKTTQCRHAHTFTHSQIQSTNTDLRTKLKHLQRKIALIFHSPSDRLSVKLDVTFFVVVNLENNKVQSDLNFMVLFCFYCTGCSTEMFYLTTIFLSVILFFFSAVELVVLSIPSADFWQDKYTTAKCWTDQLSRLWISDCVHSGQHSCTHSNCVVMTDDVPCWAAPAWGHR